MMETIPGLPLFVLQQNPPGSEAVLLCLLQPLLPLLQDRSCCMLQLLPSCCSSLPQNKAALQQPPGAPTAYTLQPLLESCFCCCMQTQLLQRPAHAATLCNSSSTQQLLLLLQQLLPLNKSLLLQSPPQPLLQCLYSLLLQGHPGCCCPHAAKCSRQHLVLLRCQQQQPLLLSL